jgi:CHAD domain-containing protein
LVERGVEIDPKFKSTLKKSMKKLSDVEKEEFAVAAREHYEKTLEPVNEYNFDLIKTRAGERANAYKNNLTILRGKHIDEFGIEMPSTDKQIKDAQRAIKTRNAEINYRNPAAEKLN